MKDGVNKVSNGGVQRSSYGSVAGSVVDGCLKHEPFCPVYIFHSADYLKEQAIESGGQN